MPFIDPTKISDTFYCFYSNKSQLPELGVNKGGSKLRLEACK